MLRQALYLLIFLRLLWPPGVCICHLFDRAPVPHHDHDDHLPGCPASKIAVTLCGMKQQAPQMSGSPDGFMLAQDLAVTCYPLETVAANGPEADRGPRPQPLYVILRALLI